MDGIPPAAKTDAEDVVWALQTADALWKRHERVDAIVWLRRAAQAAAESQNDDRALILARYAAELSEWIARHPVPGNAGSRGGASELGTSGLRVGGEPGISVGGDVLPDDLEPPPGFEDEIITNARTLAAISGEVLVPPEVRGMPRPTFDVEPRSSSAQAQERLELPKRVPPNLGVDSLRRPRPPRPGPPSETGPRPRADVPRPSASSPSMSKKPIPPPLPPRRPAAPPLPLPEPPAPEPPASMRSPESMRSQEPTMLVEDEELLPSLNLSLIEEEEDEANQISQEPPPAVASSSSAEAAIDSYEPVSLQDPQPPPEPELELERPLPEPEPLPEPPPPTDAAAFDSVTQRIKADLRALDVSTRRTATSEMDTPAEMETPAPGSTTPIPPGSVTPAPPSPTPVPRSGGPLFEVPRLDPPRIERESVDLSRSEAFSDLPDDAREAFAAAAQIHELRSDEEAAGFALAVVIEGDVDVCATIVDAIGERLTTGAVLRAQGSIGIGAPLRFVCASEQARVATWDASAVEEAFRTCPWVEEDLCEAANRTHAIVGATMGPLGERLDATLRRQITDRLDVRALEPGDVLVEKGQPVPGVVLVGVGTLEIVRDGAVVEHVSSGQFLFASSILGGGAAPATARASAEGAIILFADRMVAHELLVTCPPLLEVLAGM
ncbi:cyclic nucleotide-binding domain-containing protein [Pendulispora albinea]|uniref:Cyclic nucleotide-binding domain-containing protein n=1 Tax=Pendulispora albinea TaxID=2741071 RepID=A0ABZ2M262_9BACT